jgi:hypothetical protein
MRVAIHQPEHFPYMGFFQKMSAADLFIVLDSVKFRKNYFQNRNKIKTLAGKDEWITVPVEKRASSKKIKDVLTSSDPTWRKKIVKNISQNFKFDASEIYAHDKLLDINMSSIRWAMDKMGITTKLVFASDYGAPGNKTLLLVNLLRSVNATKYVSGPLGREYLDLSLFGGIDVEFFEPKVENHYSCLYNLS